MKRFKSILVVESADGTDTSSAMERATALALRNSAQLTLTSTVDAVPKRRSKRAQERPRSCDHRRRCRPGGILEQHKATPAKVPVPAVGREAEANHALDRPLITGVLMMRIVLVGVLLLAGSFGLFEYELALGSGEPVARTVAVAVFVVVLSFYLLNARSFTSSMFNIGVISNPAIWLGIRTMTALQALYTQLPVMHSLFGSAPMDAREWGRVFLIGFAAYLIVGFEKWVRGLRTEPAALESASEA